MAWRAHHSASTGCQFPHVSFKLIVESHPMAPAHLQTQIEAGFGGQINRDSATRL